MNALLMVVLSVMASMVVSAPLVRVQRSQEDALVVSGPNFLTLVQRSRGLAQKVLEGVNDTHAVCVYTETLNIDSPDTSSLALIARDVNMPKTPLLKVSANTSVEAALRQISEGLQTFQALLKSLLPKLMEKEKVTQLRADVRDLLIQVHKMLNLTSDAKPPASTPMELRLKNEYQVQVATHLTLVHLKTFTQDLIRYLRQLDQNEEDEEDEAQR